MELRQLRYFAAVAGQLSFSRAAAQCFVSQSAMSHQIAALERELGAGLFDRSTRSVKLTAAGSRLLPVAQQMLALELTAASVVAPPRNRLRLAGNMSFGTVALAAMSATRAHFPDLEIDFLIKDFAQRVDAVVTGEADIALVRGRIERSSLTVEPLWMGELVIVLSDQHPLIAGRATDRVSLEDLAHYPLLLPARSEQVLIHQAVADAFAASGITPTMGPAIAADRSSVLDLASHVQSWTVQFASQWIPRTGLDFAQESHTRLHIPVSAIRRSDAERTQEIAAVIDALRAAGSEHEASAR